jgi:hypothetical protein
VGAAAPARPGAPPPDAPPAGPDPVAADVPDRRAEAVERVVPTPARPIVRRLLRWLGSGGVEG